MMAEVLGLLKPQKGESYLDLTGGFGGHAAGVLEHTMAPEQAVLVDRDADAVSYLEEHFGSQGVQVVRSDFQSVSEELARKGRQFDLLLADLGVSSQHLNQSERGFAFAQDGPLDMRMDQEQTLTAERVVNTYTEEELARIIRQWGEEPKARAIAKAIVRRRPLKTTKQLAAAAASVYGSRRSKVHPATKTFQAIRIAVNGELEQLENTLPLWLDQIVAPGGRFAVISFHSLEDRLVKQAMRERAQGWTATVELLTKRPLTPSSEEIAFNPRARSAKLRVCQRK